MNEIKKIELKQDETFLYIDVTLQEEPDFSREQLYIGFDTYDRVNGEYKFNPGLDTASPFW